MWNTCFSLNTRKDGMLTILHFIVRYDQLNFLTHLSAYFAEQSETIYVLIVWKKQQACTLLPISAHCLPQLCLSAASLPVRTITINVISSLSRPFLFLLCPHTIQNLANTFQTNTLIISRAVKSKLPRWSQSVSFQMLQFPGSK